MARKVTVLNVDDDTDNVLVLFEDDSSGLSMKMGIYVPEDYLDDPPGPGRKTADDKLLDHLASAWPHKEFTQRGKPKADRQKAIKATIGVARNITSRTDSP